MMVANLGNSHIGFHGEFPPLANLGEPVMPKSESQSAMKSVTEVTACPKCTSDDLGLRYQPSPECIVVTCNECGYQTWTQCADAGARHAQV